MPAETRPAESEIRKMPTPASARPASLVVFSDDWGRHPSSCQHLIAQLLPKYKVLWVNTIGTRAPRLDRATVKRVAEKLKQWMPGGEPGRDDAAPQQDLHRNLRVINPRMWPWFSSRMDRWLNARLLSFQLNPLIRELPQPVTAVTTVPVTADMVGRLPVKEWLYYCVDDFGEWPGLDGDTLRRMDVDLTHRADRIVAVSEHLQSLISQRGRTSSLLTHGVDLEHWNSTTEPVDRPQDDAWLLPAAGPLAVFWGVVDRRLDTDMISQLAQRMTTGHVVLVGPQQDPDPQILSLPNVHAVGPRPFHELPAIARAADVLIMPYADLPVTRAMQPLKMKEYLATGRPVVVSELPAVENWRDCMDVATGAGDFAQLVLTRIHEGLPTNQQSARSRLAEESWSAKAELLEQQIVASTNAGILPEPADASLQTQVLTPRTERKA